jgi:hypothetical protein
VSRGEPASKQAPYGECRVLFPYLRLGSMCFFHLSRYCFFRTTWNQDGNCIPILATLCLYCILQLAIFAFCPIYLRVHSLGRCWDSRHHAICSNTEFSFDLEPVPQFPSNSWHRAFVLHPSAWCLRLLSIYPYVEAFRRCWDSTHYSIYLNTFCSLDPEQARQQHPNLVCTRYPTSSWRYSQLH